MCEQKFEQEQERRNGMKILAYVDAQEAEQIAEVLKRTECLSGREIIYNDLWMQSESPGVRMTCSRTEAELFRQIESLSDDAPCCYVLDHLHAVENSTDMATPLSIGRALFHAASSRGIDIVIVVRNPFMQHERALCWDLLEADADIILRP